MKARFAIAAALAAASPAAGCGPGFPEPPTVAHQEGDYQPVDYLPPAALVEVADEPPEDACVWFDGHWVWEGGEYIWKRGGWVRSHPGLYYAPWDTRVLPDGRLMFARGLWYDGEGHAVPAPPIVKSARTPPNEVTSEFEAPR